MTRLTLNYVRGTSCIRDSTDGCPKKKSCDCWIIHLFSYKCMCVWMINSSFFAPAVKSLSWWSISTWQLLTTKSHPSSTCMGLLTSYHYPTSMPVAVLRSYLKMVATHIICFNSELNFYNNRLQNQNQLF